MKNKEQKDFKPLWIYLLISIGLTLLVGVVYGVIAGINGTDLDEEVVNKAAYMGAIAAHVLIFIILMILYGKKLVKEARKLKLRDIGIIVLIGIGIIIINDSISYLFTYLKVNMENQDMVVDMLGRYQLPVAIMTALMAPIIEELVFRYSIGTFIKNDALFLIVSSLAFAIFHGIGVATILYAVIGLLLGLVYLKYKKNVVAPIIVHMLNNTLAVVAMLFL